MKKYFFVLVSFTFLMAQCNKHDTYFDDHTIAEGIIKEEGSGTPVANVQMRLRRCTYQVLGSSSCETMDTTRTDSKGFFRFDFMHEKEYQYEVRAAPDVEKYLVKDNDAPLEKGVNNNKINLILTPYSWIKLKIKKDPPFVYDSLALYGGPNGNPDWYIGAKIDFTLKFRVNGNTKNYIGWKTYRNTVNKSYETNIYCPAQDTVTYTISY